MASTHSPKEQIEEALLELEQRKAKAQAMGSVGKLAARKEAGHLNARERLAYLLDPDSFFEVGELATSYRSEMRDRTPADGKVAGFGKIRGRQTGVVANDFTVLGASSSVINGKKIKYVKDMAAKRGFPLVMLGESSGARMPDRMGAAGRAILGQDPTEYRREREMPLVSALLGDCYGSSTWYGCMSDFVVMRKGATMAVASSRVTSVAINQPVDPEELGGWRLHTEKTGLVDYATETDQEALELLKSFLSYLPQSAKDVPPETDVPEGSDEVAASILDHFPHSNTQVYDSRKIINCIVDLGSSFELKPRFGKSIVTTLARLDGRSVGIIANNPLHRGGAIDVDAMRKATSFLVLCDSFNIPLIFLVDQPGFLIGIEGEKRWAPGRIMNWMNALSQVSMPRIALTIRKNFGQAYLNMGGGRHSELAAAWPTANFGFMDPKTGVNILHGLKREDDPERFDGLVDQISQDSSAFALAGLFEAQAAIHPAETRRFLAAALGILSGAGRRIGAHHLANWPTSF
ncbi:acyl-CoA carboxylase subunit beta [Bradyrhizobium mercantei]|uniref:acyl-CoA carboxylase subunit beta n=1 Tax=Bradyrhizobium mercantei TaxID=1904807 RepID=UPI00097637D4|nr:carboxyl transferase domain-containing protein [Bradyrhizobium mercantei]